MAGARTAKVERVLARPLRPSPVAPASADATSVDVSHNLNGQRLGRKGRDTRERILAACGELLADSGEAMSMSAVARRASLGMPSLYNYFADLTELLLAMLEPIMATTEDGFQSILRSYWPDALLDERCYAFMRAFYGFWNQHARLLHLRNTMADTGDKRMLIQRICATQPLIGLFVAQMDGDRATEPSAVWGMATVLMTGIERTVTVSTDAVLTQLFGTGNRQPDDHYLRPEARLMALALRDTRDRVRAGEIA